MGVVLIVFNEAVEFAVAAWITAVILLDPLKVEPSRQKQTL